MTDLLLAVASPVEVRRPEDLFPCMTLRCRLLASVCVARQVASSSQTRDTWRGQSPRYPSCVTDLCAEGRLIRLRLGGAVEQERRGRRARRPNVFIDSLPLIRTSPLQTAARRRLAAVGLLSDVPTLDTGGGPVSPQITAVLDPRDARALAVTA